MKLIYIQHIKCKYKSIPTQLKIEVFELIIIIIMIIFWKVMIEIFS